jgi:phospho-N-acetylmuramoyl-pentapeptide-transferase
MLLWLTEYLAHYVTGFSVFEYLTFRTMVSVVTALAMSLLIGPHVIAQLSRYQISQTVRNDGPQSHLSKAGTPTMGGALILIVIFSTTLLWGDLSNRYVWTVLIVTMAFGAIGWIDDYLKISRRNSRGLIARWKYLWQSVFGLGAAVFLYLTADQPAETELIVPFFKEIAIPLGVSYIVIAYFVIVGTSNAVNLTDGLDGLATGCVAVGALTFAAIAYTVGRADASDYLYVFHIPGAGELTVFCASLGGAALGFLWFNGFPASVFMGDTGSLALGGSLGLVAVATRHELTLLVVGGVFVVEAVSVILQRRFYRLTNGRRLLRCAPLHHHYQFQGLHEVKVTVRFWIVSVLLALVALALLKMR